MSESEPPKKRRFWQLHLSTAIVLMLIVAVGLGLNLYGFVRTSYGFPMQRSYGWPLMVAVRNLETHETLWFYSSVSALVINTFIIVSFTFNIAFVLEYIIRRREARKL
jgi:hypothetical protein